MSRDKKKNQFAKGIIILVVVAMIVPLFAALLSL